MLCRHRNFVLILGLVTALNPLFGYADQNIDLTANIVASTCQVEVSNNGVVDLGTVTLDYFADNVTPTTDYAGGKTFNVNVVSCDYIQTTQSQMKLDFQPQAGSLAQVNNQIFINEYEQQSTGAKNVGIVIFSAQPNQQTFNVRERMVPQQQFIRSRGDAVPSTWTFYSRMQRVNNALPPESGMVRSQVIVNVSYE